MWHGLVQIWWRPKCKLTHGSRPSKETLCISDLTSMSSAGLVKHILRFCHRSDGRHGFEKNISSCTLSYTALPMKTDLHFQPTLSKLQNFQQPSILLFFVFLKTLRNYVALTTLFPRCAAQSKDVLVHKDRYIYLLWAIFEGTLVIVYQKNAPLRYNTTCSESESRNFDCQWTLVSFLVKHNQFYREARLTCPLYRSTEDICIGICVFKRVFNVWHILKKSVSM